MLRESQIANGASEKHGPVCMGKMTAAEGACSAPASCSGKYRPTPGDRPDRLRVGASCSCFVPPGNQMGVRGMRH